MARFVPCAETRDELTCCVNPAIKCFLPKTRIFIQEKGRKRNILYLLKLSSDSLMNYGVHYFRICLPFLQLERLSVMLPKSINNLFKPYLSKWGEGVGRTKSQVSHLYFKKDTMKENGQRRKRNQESSATNLLCYLRGFLK